MVLINISNSYSIIPYIIFFQYYRAINTLLLLFLNIAYLLFRFGNRSVLSFKDPLFLIFIILNSLNYLFGAITDTFGYGTFPYLFANFAFYILLYNLFKDYISRFNFDKSINLILRGYLWFVILGLLSVFSLFILITFFDFYPKENDIGASMDLFKSNLRDARSAYYFPNNISILFDFYEIRIPFFQKYGIITGLFHEPHTCTFLLTPAFFILLRYVRRLLCRFLLFLIFLIFLLIEASTTSILAFFFVFFVFFMIEYKKNILYPMIILGCAVFVFLSIDPIFYDFIIGKISGSSSGSLNYSRDTILFAFTPKTLIGTNFFNLGYLDTYWNTPDKSMNVGFINFILNLCFLFIFIYRIVKVNLYRDIRIRFIALFTLYFLLHSMKIAMVTYSLSYLIFVMFLLQVLNNKHKYSTQNGFKKD